MSFKVPITIQTKLKRTNYTYNLQMVLKDGQVGNIEKHLVFNTEQHIPPLYLNKILLEIPKYINRYKTNIAYLTYLIDLNIYLDVLCWPNGTYTIHVIETYSTTDHPLILRDLYLRQQLMFKLLSKHQV